MPRIFVGNFEFEHELIHGQRELSREAKAVAADLVAAWIAVADADDIIWSPTGVPSFDFREVRERRWELPQFVSTESQLPRGSDWELVPWGWTAQLQAWGERHDWHCPAPPAEVVRQVNSRAFRWQLESELGVSLPGSRVLYTLDEIDACVERGSADGLWVLKANYGMSGRERLLGCKPRMSVPDRNWVRNRLMLGGFVFEPWVNRIAEIGIQWEIPLSGVPHLIGMTLLLTDRAGVYRGSRLMFKDEDGQLSWRSAIDVTRQVATRLQQEGYWGPLGVDSMWYTDHEGKPCCRPLQDLNARYTMGRMALGFCRRLPEGYSAEWLHDRALVDATLAIQPKAKAIQTTARSWLVMYPG